LDISSGARSGKNNSHDIILLVLKDCDANIAHIPDGCHAHGTSKLIERRQQYIFELHIGYRHCKRDVVVDQILKIIILCGITGRIQQEKEKIENQRHEKRRN